ncbi:hypothetical protein BS17DRAFT_65834 [Gyrodon lividus]|nr:hypothetical protein BS17DRAFT_65834 [Gyrodon lividus]
MFHVTCRKTWQRHSRWKVITRFKLSRLLPFGNGSASWSFSRTQRPTLHRLVRSLRAQCCQVTTISINLIMFRISFHASKSGPEIRLV